MNEKADPLKSTATSPPRKYFIFKTFIMLCMLILIASVVFYVTQYRDVAIRISKDTTLHTEPVGLNGQVDFLRAYEQMRYSEEIATDKNGFRMIIENIDIFKDAPGPHFENVCRKLGLDPSKVKSKIVYVDPYEFTNNYFKSDDFDEAFVLQLEKELGEAYRTRQDGKDLSVGDVSEALVTRSVRPWTGNDLPMMEKWIQQVTPALDLYAKAVRKPRFEIPFSRKDDTDSMYETALYHAQVLRSVARGYYSRANYYLGRGEIQKAIDDVISCKRLGRHVRNRSTFVDRLVGVAIEGIADSIGIVDVKNSRTSKQDLDYFAKELDSLPPVSKLEESLVHNKLALMDWLQAGANWEKDDWIGDSKALKQLRKYGLNWNIVLREFSQTYDELWESQTTWKHKEIEVTNVDKLSRATRSKKFGRNFARQNYGIGVKDSEKRIDCTDRIRRITIAMLRYEKNHGKLPPAYSSTADGQPMHSWRVLLLPYLGENELYEKLRLNEPWDSEHNSAFLTSRPDVFDCPGFEKCSRQQTCFTVIVGPETAFDGNEGKTLANFGPHSNDLILIAERRQPIDWMDPTKEIKQSEAEKGLKSESKTEEENLALGNKDFAGAVFGFRDGGSEFLSDYHDLELFQAQLKGLNQRLLRH